MSVKLLLVIEDSEHPSDNRVRRLRANCAVIDTEAKAWLNEGGCGVLTLLLARGTRLRVSQTGPEILTEPPQIEVKYSDLGWDAECGICGNSVLLTEAAPLYNGEPCHSACVKAATE